MASLVDGYRVVFDIAEAGYQWQSLTIGLAPIAAATLVILLGMLFDKRNRRPAIILLILFSSATMVVFAATFYRYASLVQGKRAGRVAIVEGAVNNFKPGGSHRRESFCVESSCFEYSRNAPMDGFINAESQGGPIIKDGLQVRVTHVAGTIVRLEVAE